MSVIEKSVTDLIDQDYRTYSMYVIEQRAIPSAIDGLKPSQRKLLYALLDKGGESKKIKVAELGGALSSYNYLHGEMSAMGAAVSMAQEWCNNAPLFEGHGNFGSKLVHDSAAPRYIYVTLGKVYNKVFSDVEICPKNEDPENPEPQHYLPVVPWVLVNGVKGIAVGFATDILPRSLPTLTEAVQAVLSGSKLTSEVTPTFPQFKGTVVSLGNNQWKTVGTVSHHNLTFKITELPYGSDREGYVNFLNDLIDAGKISDYEDYCDESGFNFEVKVNRTQRDTILKDVNRFFKLEKTFSENITTLDEHGRLKLFNNAQELIEYFVKYRTKKFGEKIQYEIDRFSNKLQTLENKLKFVKKVLNREVDFRDFKNKQELIDWIVQNVCGVDQAKSLATLQVYECTHEEVQSLESKIEQCKKELTDWTKETPVGYYKKQLKSLLKSI